ncbi:MAG TPA: aldose 1-epimerase family protein [Pseudonocardia sp.]
MADAPSGRQVGIDAGGQRATLVEVGGGIREYVVDGRHVLDGYPVDEMCSGARGTPLAPWPNRLADGRYTFDGRDHQLPLTEPSGHNAIHGLLRWANWTVREEQPSRAVLGVVLHPQTGYPFTLDMAVEYALDGNGLTVTTTATNRGASPCPFACGQHPYLTPGGPTVDGATLSFAATTSLVTDERGLPTGTAEVAGTALDFRTPHPIGDTVLDHAFTGLERDSDGLAVVRLSGPDGHPTDLWADRSYPYLQLFTGDTQAPDKRRRGLAVEPMTAPPDALRTGEGLLVLAPGESFTGRWGIRPG